ncbi:MAG: sodium:solute symporter [Gemmatimonadales bacterium]|nr:sodium:solute symporter [Gemmatimonadales bacterium]NIN11434.1 sodium:solute symporter [Gemmatimonadales bacterium]NIN50043.1 sodium:solute symporter [Gemmatimonadales bacterium]NIP07507.1 sodium:solute symporter [Gemmatimonadales bacterium]NIR03149.1 sodium:solute symporter [Gemmatimonadales bacterium]
MESFGWLSIVPPVVAIALAIKTKQVYLSLALFVWLGWTIMNGWDPLAGLIQSVDVYVASVTDLDNARVLMFSVLIGSMITLTQASGGMEGFVSGVERLGLARSKRSVGLMTAGVSMAVFLESNFGLLVSGSVARPLYDKFRISREKLSYVIDATCSPKCILIGSLLPLNAWGAYVARLLVVQGIERPATLLAAAVPLNFYSVLALLLAFVVILTGWNLGSMREAERRVSEDGKVLRDGAKPMVSEEVSGERAKEGAPRRAINMVLPITTMVGTVPIVLWFTGDGDLSAGSGSQAVLWGVIVGVLVAVVSYRIQDILTIEESTQEIIKGIQGLIPLVIVLSLAFAIGTTTRALGTGVFVAQAAQATLPSGVIPALVFLLACFIAFSTGTSWGTFAIMIPIVIPMVELLDLHPALALGAALGGGIFGDHCSPISDTTIVASMASATDHIDHVRTQLPYALVAAAAATVLFLIVGWIL